MDGRQQRIWVRPVPPRPFGWKAAAIRPSSRVRALGGSDSGRPDVGSHLRERRSRMRHAGPPARDPDGCERHAGVARDHGPEGAPVALRPRSPALRRQPLSRAENGAAWMPHVPSALARAARSGEDARVRANAAAAPTRRALASQQHRPARGQEHGHEDDRGGDGGEEPAAAGHACPSRSRCSDSRTTREMRGRCARWIHWTART